MGIKYLKPEDAYQAYQQGVTIIDVREEMEVADKRMDLEAVVYAPFSDFKNIINRTSKDKPVVLCCAIGLSSESVACKMLDAGYKDVSVIQNGLVAWEKAKLPLLNINKSGCQCGCYNHTEED